MPAKLDLTGQKFGRLTVLYETAKRAPDGNIIWCCQCSCSENTIVEVEGCSLRRGFTQSCGCYNVECTKNANTKHGAKANYQRHPLYNIWEGMLKRCYNRNHKSYHNYGGRGIAVCKAWKISYVPFRNYMLSLPNCPINAQTPGAHLERSIDRYPNKDGHYEPGNIRWATQKEQMNNTCDTLFITVNGVSLPFREAAEKYGKVTPETIYQRIRHGWSNKDAFTKPIGSRQ